MDVAIRTEWTSVKKEEDTVDYGTFYLKQNHEEKNFSLGFNSSLFSLLKSIVETSIKILHCINSDHKILRDAILVCQFILDINNSYRWERKKARLKGLLDLTSTRTKTMCHQCVTIKYQKIHTDFTNQHNFTQQDPLRKKAGQHQFTCNTPHKQQNWPCVCSGSLCRKQASYHNVIKMSLTKTIYTDMLKIKVLHIIWHLSHKYKTLYMQREASILTEIIFKHNVLRYALTHERLYWRW